MAEQSSDRAARLATRRFESSTEADRHDLEFWLRIPEHERVLQVWRLSQELWRLRGELPDEPGLCRSVAPARNRPPRRLDRCVTCQIGVAPGRIDILTELTGITFADAWPERMRRPFGDIDGMQA